MCQHKGLLPLWLKPWVYCRYGLSPIVFTFKRESAILPGFIRVPLTPPLAPQIGPTSQRADQSALAVRGPVGRVG